MHSLVQPNAWVCLRLPSDTLKIIQVVPNTIVSLGKYGTFSSNLILERPYNLTYELLDRKPGVKDSELRIVPAAEIHADTIAEEEAAKNSNGPDEKIIIGGDGVEFQLVGENGEVIMRSNRETIDDSARQTLTMEEIEELKREGTGAGKDLIAKLMASHLGLDQKTAFSLAKYKLLKTKKYLRRFTILPVDVPMLVEWMNEEKDAGKILELRQEMLALVGSWSNVHFSELPIDLGTRDGRWLVVDETGGLLVAALAERMGILYPDSNDYSSNQEDEEETYRRPDPPLATSNTITLIHNNAQPNLSLLKYFSYDPTATSTSPLHPLSTNLHPLSWLQLLSPQNDTVYSTPIPPISPEILSTYKSGKRGTYYRKLRRHTRVKTIVDNTIAGGFSGLVIASHMDPVSILKHTIPLLRGGAQIAIYSPTIEPLVSLSDIYSTSRRTAFIQSPPLSFTSLSSTESDKWQGDEDFPLNPTLLLNSNVQSARIREWQVLPGRTHPVMTQKGGAEGFLFTAVRVLPARGRVEARGKFGRRRDVKNGGEGEGEDGVVLKKGVKSEEDRGDEAKREDGEGRENKRVKVELEDESEAPQALKLENAGDGEVELS